MAIRARRQSYTNILRSIRKKLRHPHRGSIVKFYLVRKYVTLDVDVASVSPNVKSDASYLSSVYVGASDGRNNVSHFVDTNQSASIVMIRHRALA